MQKTVASRHSQKAKIANGVFIGTASFQMFDLKLFSMGVEECGRVIIVVITFPHFTSTDLTFSQKPTVLVV